MNDLKEYIIEKLKIDKDTKIYDSFKEGDLIVRVAIYNISGKSSDEMEIFNSGRSDDLYYFYDFDDNDIIRFIHNFDIRGDGKKHPDRYDYESDRFINSNGHYEYYSKGRPFKSTSIYLNKKDGIEFIEDLISNKVNVIKKYFDKSDSFRSIQLRNSNSNLKSYLDLIKNDRS